ncbi:endosomal integral membrane protein, putative [Trypanosoma brucei gambiense DAL972]|uniref:Transmembrane 9 superfamily member n=2 Tax=Trypanosoma brucei TaxID=5691 RepID=C9ZLW2_TRYB9|nr:endosomal integral membrane protein, putative [Trypanosoma brucei gambiense DAL972]RHW72942.1 endosomal integral membrane protein [Trypanosoma brucei equiperdum]CBH10387.1 endosomal integral membrane protein, putative [Trypanosoma brucei gambiense DAL972]|eukprot:XP_011772677.1 endosomal integral membrane protein, putative [Trypanosoma brucei gambiense DAL972]
MGYKFHFYRLVLVLFVFSVNEASSSFFKITAPIGYKEGDEVPVLVNSLTSSKGVVPYDFYKMKACKPAAHVLKEGSGKENLGELLLGNHVLPSLYSVNVLRNVTCQPLCIVSYTEGDKKDLDNLITQSYRGHMFLAGLPLVERIEKGTTEKLRLGYRLGVHVKGDEKLKEEGAAGDKCLINNHIHFTITYAVLPNGEYMLTGFYAKPKTLNSPTGCPPDGASVDEWPDPASTGATNVAYSYSVTWEQDSSEGVFVTRWDVYWRLGGAQRKKAHLTALFNSMLLLGFLGVLVMIVLLRIVRRDLLMQNDMLVSGDVQEESGWKLVRGDVFRAPSRPLVLTGLVSSGCQMVAVVVLTVISSAVRKYQPWHSGNLLTNLIIFFCCSSCVSGYVAGKMLVFFQIRTWKNGIAAVTMVPLSLLLGYLAGNMISWSKHGSTAVSLPVLLTLFFLWVAVPVPLSLIGLSAGFRASAFVLPTKVGSIPRAISQQSVRRRYMFILGGGIVSFTAAFMEVICVLGSFWKGQPFLYVGYLFGVSFIISAVCAEVAVVVTYAMLSEEDYEWWWGSFCTSGSCGVYFFLYSVVYLYGALEIRQPLSVILFLVYTFEVSVFIAVFLGTMGFVASAVFVRTIYNSIKAD